jgi:hypothetical protein
MQIPMPNELPSSSSSMPNTNKHFDGLDDVQVDNKTATELSRLNELKKEAVENED